MTIRPLGPWLLAAALLSHTVAASTGSPTHGLRPRAPYDTGPVRAARLPADSDAAVAATSGHRLTIKFMDAVRGRAAADGGVRSLAGADLSAVRALAAEHGLGFDPLIRVDEDTLAALEARAAARSGQAQPDLAGMLAVHVPEADVARLEAVGQALQDLPVVEYAHIELLGAPPPGDIAPATPDHTNLQTYFDAAAGMDVTGAHALGQRGAGVRISDCEYGWNGAHEDLVDIEIHPEPGQTIAPGVFSNGWDSHGTAVLGETSSVDNAYGCTGMAPDADVYTYTEWSVEQGFRRLTAITHAINDSDPGDVVLLEMQTVNFGSSYGPAELDPSVHSVCKLGVQAGVIVVGAAGNGNQDLDSATYSTYMGWGDSGAILVGAGTANASHSKLSFSTYGSRVDVQGWGSSVFTLGYGSFAQYGGDKDQRYASGFSGTSSASPFVASAAAIGSALVLANTGGPVDPAVLRQTLIDTGTPQGSGGHIGPLPDIPAALVELGGIVQGSWSDLGNGLAGLIGAPALTGAGPQTAGSTVNLQLSNAIPFGTTHLVIGASRIDAAFKGGVMLPAPDIVLGGLPLSAGGLLLSFPFPAGVPAGAELYYQHWVADATGPLGFTASNGLRGTSP